MFEFLYKANNLLGCMTVAIFIPLGRDLLSLFFTQEYAMDAYWPLSVFMLTIVFYSMGFGMVAKAIERPHILLWSKLAVIANIVLGVPLAMQYGAVGMAVASAVSIILKNGIIYLLVRRYVDLQIPWNATVKCILNTVITVLILCVMKTLPILHMHTGVMCLRLSILCVCGIAIYVALSKTNNVFTVEQRDLVCSLVPKKVRGIVSAVV